MHVAIDIETKPQSPEKIAALIPPFDEGAVKYGNTKDPEKRAALLERRREEHVNKYMTQAALHASTAEVLVFAWHKLPSGGGYLEQETFGESGLLHEVWQRLVQFAFHQNCWVVGHNILDFDLPFLFRRSLLRGVQVPDCLWERGRDGFIYWHQRFVDTLRIWRVNRSSNEPASFNVLAASMGHPTKDEAKSREFWKLWAEDQTAAIEHVQNDVKGPYDWFDKWDVLFKE